MFFGKLVAVLHLCFWVGSGGLAPDSSPADTGACWATGNWSCVDSEPYLLVATGNAILRMSLDGSDQGSVMSGVGGSVLLDFHSREGSLYWVNTHTGVLSRVHLPGGHRQKLLSLGKGISGLAVDWIENTVFWSSKKRGTIQRAQTDGKNETTVLRNLSQPSSVVIDPNNRYLFWLAAGVTSDVQRSDLVGGERTSVLKVRDQLLALAIDPVERRLFWVQQSLSKLTSLGSCDYNGNLINVVVSQPLRSKSVKISVFLNYVYMTDTLSKSVIRVNKHTGGSPEKLSSGKMQHVPADIRVIHRTIQPVAEAGTPMPPVCDPQEECVCSSTSGSGRCVCRRGFTLSKQGGFCEDVNECAHWNHGCSLGCENVPGSYFCTCPNGYMLLPDTKTCREIEPCVENGTLCDHACTHTPEGDVCVCPVGSTLQPDGRSCTGCLSLDGGGCSQVCVTLSPGRWECECQPGYQLQPDGKQCKATGPTAYLLYANTVDIRRVNTDGTGDRRVLGEAGDSILALDYDPVQNKVYFASTSRQQIERVSMEGGSREVVLFSGLETPEGLAVDWINRKLYWTDKGLSSICRSGLDGVDREVLVYEKILKPRGIAVHPQAQKVFWTDMGGRPAVECSGLGGEGREVLVNTGLVSPSGLSLDYTSQRLYWCDITTGLIESANMDGSDRHTLRQNEVGRPFDVSVFEDSLWVSSWDDNQLHRLSKRTGNNPERFRGDSVQPAALIIVHPLAKPGADPCLYGNGGCSQLCESRFGLADCSCHSQHVLSADRKTCLPTEKSSTALGDGAWSLKNKTLNDESVPLGVPAGHSDAGEPVTFTESMVSDQDECFALSCDRNAQCVLEGHTAVCHCLSGYTGDGHLCVDTDECTEDLAECDGPRSECVNTAGGYICQCRTGFSGDGHHCTDIDECHLEMHRCDVNAICLNTLGGYDCRCRDGYTGSGFRCHEDPVDAPSTSSPLEVTFPWQRDNSIRSCPSTHESFCMYDGVCFYLPELESYICNCVAGYMGERCQFSDVEWWDLQRAEQGKRRNVAIAVCLGLLVLLSITASLTYCYRCRRCLRERPPVDSISERSMSEESITELPSSSPQLYVVLEHGACSSANMVHIVGRQRRRMCPSSSSSETGESFVSEEAGTLMRDKRLLGLTKCSTSCDVIKLAADAKPTRNLISLDDSQHLPQPNTMNLPQHLPQPSTMNLPQPSTMNLPQPNTMNLPQHTTMNLPQPNTMNLTHNLTEHLTQHLPQPNTQHLPQPNTQHLTQPDTEVNTQPNIQHLPQPNIQHLTQSDTQCNIQLNTEFNTQPNTQHLTHPDTQHLAHPDTQHLVHPDTQHLVHPDTQHLTHPDTQHLVHPDTQHLTHPDTQHLTHPDTQHLTHSDIQHLPQPDTQYNIQLNTEFNTQPNIQHLTQPNTQPDTQYNTQYNAQHLTQPNTQTSQHNTQPNIQHFTQNT